MCLLYIILKVSNGVIVNMHVCYNTVGCLWHVIAQPLPFFLPLVENLQNQARKTENFHVLRSFDWYCILTKDTIILLLILLFWNPKTFQFHTYLVLPNLYILEKVEIKKWAICRRFWFFVCYINCLLQMSLKLEKTLNVNPQKPHLKTISIAVIIINHSNRVIFYQFWHHHIWVHWGFSK